MKSGEKMQKIMIVEDDQVIKKELQNLLENAGYQTETLENFKEAKKEILKSPVDLILYKYSRIKWRNFIKRN